MQIYISRVFIFQKLEKGLVLFDLKIKKKHFSIQDTLPQVVTSVLINEQSAANTITVPEQQSVETTSSIPSEQLVGSSTPTKQPKAPNQPCNILHTPMKDTYQTSLHHHLPKCLLNQVYNIICLSFF